MSKAQKSRRRKILSSKAQKSRRRKILSSKVQKSRRRSLKKSRRKKNDGVKRKHDFDNYEFIELFSNDTKPITAEDLSFLLDKESEEIDPDFKLEEFGTDELGIKKLVGSKTLINTFKDSIKCPYCIEFKTYYDYDLSCHIQKKHPIKTSYKKFKM